MNPFDTSYHSYVSRSVNNTFVSAGLKSHHRDLFIKERGLTVIGAALSFISTLVGASIISLPYALS
jgi:hypothetical protein